MLRPVNKTDHMQQGINVRHFKSRASDCRLLATTQFAIAIIMVSDAVPPVNSTGNIQSAPPQRKLPFSLVEMDSSVVRVALTQKYLKQLTACQVAVGVFAGEHMQ